MSGGSWYEPPVRSISPPELADVSQASAHSIVGQFIAAMDIAIRWEKSMDGELPQGTRQTPPPRPPDEGRPHSSPCLEVGEECGRVR